MSNDAVDSTEYIPISDLESPPIITLCPRQGYYSKLLEWRGYASIKDFLLGNDKIRNNCNFLTFN